MSTSTSKKLSLFAITWPIFVEQLAHMLPGTVDTFMVSHLGDNAVAGLAVANQIVIFCIILFTFVGLGTGVVMTHFLGAGDRAGAEKIAATAIGANFWLGVVISLSIFFFSTDLLHLMHLPPKLLPYAQPFLALMGGTLFLESLNIALGAVLRSHGHTRDVMLVTVGMNALNLALNAVLIFGLFGAPKLGVVGAATSTVISRFVACVASFLIVRWRTGATLHLRDFYQFSGGHLRKILHIGLPAAGENIAWWASFMVVTYFIGQMGETALATFAYTMQISWLLMAFGISIGIGTEIMIGHMVGAGDLDAVYRQLLRGLRLGLVVIVVVVILAALTAPHLIDAFTDNATIITGGAFLLRMGLILEPDRTFNLVVINALRATGDARFPVLMGVFSMWGLLVPLSWFLGLHLGWGLPGVWIAFIVDEWTRGIMMYLRWKSRVWEKYARTARHDIQAMSHG